MLFVGLFLCRKNGKLVGTYPKDVKIPLYPSVGLHSPNERYDVLVFDQRIICIAYVTYLFTIAHESSLALPSSESDAFVTV
jgi:hypothetical protein